VHVRDTVVHSLFWLGNNHLLNTLLIKAATSLFGLSEWTIRLPALLGHVLYLSGAYAVTRRFLRRLFLPGFSLLVLNPFLLELFSAARGYALGLGFLMWSVYFLLARVSSDGGPERENARARNLAAGLAGLAVLSQLVFLFPYVAVLTGLALCEWTGPRGRGPGRFGKHCLWRLRYPLAVTLGLLAIYLGPVLFMYSIGGFFHGGDRGFWADTVTSLITAVLYLRSYPAGAAGVMGMLVASLAVAGLIVLSKEAWRGRLSAGKTRVLLTLGGLLFFTAALMTVSHYVFGIKFLIGRMAVFLIPLFLLYVLAFLDVVSRPSGKAWPRAAGLLLFGLAALNAVHMARCANISYYAICPYTANARAAVERVAELHAAAPKPEKMTLGIAYDLGPSAHFYKLQKGLDWLNIVDIENLRRPADYYYLIDPGSPAYKEFHLADEYRCLRGTNLRVIGRFPLSGTFLAKAVP
jgi:hypothetical protein